MKKQLLLLVMILLSMVARAASVEINGIYYHLDYDGKFGFAYVTSNPNKYTGSIDIPESVIYNDVTYRVTYIGSSAFSSCYNLTSVTIPNSVTGIGNSAFEYCTSLTSIAIPNSVTSIGNCAFQSCYGLTSVTIPNSVTSIDYGVFRYCHGLTSVTIPNSVTSIGRSAFVNCGLTSIAIPNSVTSIGGEAFSGCPCLTSITIPNSVTDIGDNVFKDCTGLTSVTIPNSVTSIGESAFRDCYHLTSITIPNSVMSIGESAFYGCSKLTSVIIGSGVTSIGYYAFGYGNLKKVIWLTNTPPTGYNYVNGAINYVSNNNFTSLSNKVVYPFLSSYFDVDGIRYVPVSPSERTCDAIDCVYNESVENTIIGKSVSYKGIDLTIENVNPYICASNTFIKSLKMSYEGDISDYAFQGCSSLQTVTLNDKISSICSYAFDNCSSLKDIVIPNSITTIGDNAFSNTGLASITIPNSVATIGSSAFRNCTGLTSITIPNSVKSIGNDAFAECNGLTLVTLHCESIGSWFSGLTSIIKIVTGDEVTSIGDSAFKGCTKLNDVNIGESVKTIGDWSFSGCNSLDHFVSGSKVENIGQGAFSDCTAMTKFISRAVTPPVCGTQALDDINKWNCILQVPEVSIPVYQTADQWKEFFFIEAIKDVIMGDVNSDNLVNVTDIVATVNYIMEKPSEGFNKEAADLNGDGEINVTDIVKMVSIIMSGDAARRDADE